MNRAIIFIIMIFTFTASLLIVGKSNEVATEGAVVQPAPSPSPESTPQPTNTAIPPVKPSSTVIVDAPDNQPLAAPLVAEEAKLASLKAIFTQNLQARYGLDPATTVEVAAFQLAPVNDEKAAWLLRTTSNIKGMGAIPLAVYRPDGQGWQEIATTRDHKLTLRTGRIRQISLDAANIWLEYFNPGAHGGCYGLLRFDEKRFHHALSYCNAADEVGTVLDLDQDGTNELLLDQSDPYVSCYACGVIYIDFQVLQWTGSRFSEVGFKRFDTAAEPALRTFNNKAVELAEAGLWLEARAAIEQATALDGQNKTVAWNGSLIQRHINGYIFYLFRDGGYPLLTYILLGDYRAALQEIAPYGAEEIFSRQGPLIDNTVMEGAISALGEHVTRSASQALSLDPNLAAAYFFRGWGRYLLNPNDPDLLADIQKAAKLEPHNLLYRESKMLFEP